MGGQPAMGTHGCRQHWLELSRVEPRGEAVTKLWGRRVVRGLLGEGWHHSHTAGAARGLSMEWGWEVARLIQGHAGHPVKLELQRTVNTCFV